MNIGHGVNDGNRSCDRALVQIAHAETLARLASSNLRISFALAKTIAFLDSGMTTTAVSSAKMISPGLTSTRPSMTGSLIEAVFRSHLLETGDSPRTPQTVVESLLRAAKAAHADPAVKAKLEVQGLEISGQSGPEFESDIRAQAERWARLVKAAGFKAD